MRRYLFHIHLLGTVNRDHTGAFHASDSQAVARGRSVADGIAENDRHRSVIVTVERAGGPVLARVTATKAMPPWQSASSKFEHAWRELSGLDSSQLRGIAPAFSGRKEGLDDEPVLKDYLGEREKADSWLAIDADDFVPQYNANCMHSVLGSSSARPIGARKRSALERLRSLQGV